MSFSIIRKTINKEEDMWPGKPQMGPKRKRKGYPQYEKVAGGRQIRHGGNGRQWHPELKDEEVETLAKVNRKKI